MNRANNDVASCSTITDKTLASTITFGQFASLLDAMFSRPAAKKKEALKSFLDKWRAKYKAFYPDNPQPPVETFFPLMRLLIPDADRDRPTRGAAQMLIHWKQRKPPNAWNAADVSDFAGVAFFVMLNRNSKKGEISIEEVNRHLDGFADANTITGDERKERNRKLMHELFTRMNAGELKWLLRIILKDLKLGMGHEKIMDVFHPDASDLFDVCMNLSTVCTKLNDPEVRMSEIEMHLFDFVRPMLSDSWKPDKLRALLKGGPMIAEIKYDGERVQIHKQGKTFKYFSRGGHDITDDLGASATEGTLTRYIADCFHPEAINFIIDGEICPYSVQEKCIATKLESSAIKNLTGATGFQVCFVAFDCLLHNDKTLTALPLIKRTAVLRHLFQQEEGRLYHAVTQTVTTPEECYSFLNDAIDRNEEGIILKDPTTVYKPNKRDHAGWWKIKPEYLAELSDSLDVLVVGGYYGSGRRSGPSHFLVAVAEDCDVPGTHPTRFRSFCKVGSGYTMAELQDINHKLDRHWRKWTDSCRPPFLTHVGPKADLWVEPQHSFVVRINASQLWDSESFATACTLRFPRMQEARLDKHWYDCMTMSQLVALQESSKGRLGAKRIDDDYLTGEGNPRKRQKVGVRAPALKLASEYRPADLHGLEVTGHIFAGKELCVIGDGTKHSKQDLERLVAENGGSCVQNPTVRTFCIICQKKTNRANNLFNQLKLNVVLPDWLVRCAEAKAFVPWQPEDFVFCTDAAKKMMKSAFDKYGDSFTARITQEDFERYLLEMENEKRVTKEEMIEFEQEHLYDVPLMGVFRQYRAYIDKFETVNDPTSKDVSEGNLALAEQYLLAAGAEVSSKLDDSITHVVVHGTGSLARLDELKKMNRSRGKKFHVVTEQWVLDSYEEQNPREERGYIARLPVTNGRVEKVNAFEGLFD
ncbi:DNA ligase 4 [Hypsibius exemplaris]|uniref:DNA ligase n=1 Tax=Hypsibius exemplaris TaxID=2072580 RepID=A0A9X6NJG3_HYPEX|nr:DNA ligase 4 [Hypsibius exemplaris]